MAHIKLILLEDVENLGLAGTEVSVTPGYARNYLLPRNLAAKATPGILRVLAAKQEKLQSQRKDELQAAQALATRLSDKSFEIAMQASEDSQLFGSVTVRTVAEALAKAGFTVDHQRIVLDEAIKLLGDYEVKVKLHHEVVAAVKLSVVRA